VGPGSAARRLCFWPVREKNGKELRIHPFTPPPTARPRDSVTASSTRCRRLYDTYGNLVNAAALSVAFSPRSPCTIFPLCLPSGTHFEAGSAEAYQNTMRLPRLPGCSSAGLTTVMPCGGCAVGHVEEHSGGVLFCPQARTLATEKCQLIA
jgi:hypothetical protein